MIGAGATDAFFCQVDGEDGAFTTWSSEVTVIREDDGAVTSVSGIGDRAAQGAVKEFAAESDGYIADVVNADVSNPSTAKPHQENRKAADQQYLTTDDRRSLT